MAGATYVTRLASLLVAFSFAISAECVVLDVQYPVESNYSFVRLTCVGEFKDPLEGDQRPAVFLRNGSDLTIGSELVSVMMKTEDSISFFFDQTQEGEFSCRTALGEESSPEPLAGENNNIVQTMDGTGRIRQDRYNIGSRHNSAFVFARDKSFVSHRQQAI